MGQQTLRWPHFIAKYKRLTRSRARDFEESGRVTCPASDDQQWRSLKGMAKHGVVILAMVVILLSALAVCTGIFLAIVNYQTSAADRALYELQHLPSIVNGR